MSKKHTPLSYNNQKFKIIVTATQPFFIQNKQCHCRKYFRTPGIACVNFLLPGYIRRSGVACMKMFFMLLHLLTLERAKLEEGKKNYFELNITNRY
jgi:hypothetical protein